MPTANALPGRTHWQGGDQLGRQAHKLEETLSYEHNTKQDEKMLYFIETTHEVAETVIFRQYVPVKCRAPVLQNEDSSCGIRVCNASNTASTPKISDGCTAAAVDTACARGSVLLFTTSMSIRTRALFVSKR